MGLSLLILTGALLGWLATIVLQIEDGREIGRYIVFGLVGAVIAGFATAEGLIFGSVTALTLLAGVAGAIVTIAAGHLAFRRNTAD